MISKYFSSVLNFLARLFGSLHKQITRSDKSEMWHEGYQAQKEIWKRHSNPYAAGSIHAKEWSAGAEQAVDDEAW